MPPRLGVTDSFNSSSATIRAADDKQRTRATAGRSGIGLGPADSVGREFDALIRGQVGVLQSETGAGDRTLLNDYIRNYQPDGLFNPNTPLQPGQSSASLGRLPSDLTGLMFLQNPEGGPLFDMPAVPETTAEAESTDPSRDASGSASVPHTPSSHRSHHSRHSLSSTDVDSDVSYFTDGSVSSPSRAGITDLGSLGIGGLDLSQPPTPSATISPTAEGLGRRPKRTRKSEEVEDTPSPGPSNASEEPLQAVDEETRRQQRLEHRRSINRKSAQKHRLRRKEELSDYKVALAERDARIRSLEDQLTAAQAKLAHLTLMYERMNK